MNRVPGRDRRRDSVPITSSCATGRRVAPRSRVSWVVDSSAQCRSSSTISIGWIDGRAREEVAHALEHVVTCLVGGQRQRRRQVRVGDTHFGNEAGDLGARLAHRRPERRPGSRRSIRTRSPRRRGDRAGRPPCRDTAPGPRTCRMPSPRRRSRRPAASFRVPLHRRSAQRLRFRPRRGSLPGATARVPPTVRHTACGRYRKARPVAPRSAVRSTSASESPQSTSHRRHRSGKPFRLDALVVLEGRDPWRHREWISGHPRPGSARRRPWP